MSKIRFLVLLGSGLGAGVLTWYLANSYLVSLQDQVAKATVAAGTITLFGVIFSAVYGEISAYYKARSASINRRWKLIYPFIKNDYIPWINSARSFVSCLQQLDPKEISDEAITRVLFLTMIFFGYRLRFIMNDGGLILLSTDKEETKVMEAYRQIERKFNFAKDETPKRVSYLQGLYLSKNTPDKPYVLAKFAEDLANDDNIKGSRDKLQLWLTEENIQNLRTALANFADCFKASVDKLYSAWSN
jgi:hypothetical protein